MSGALRVAHGGIIVNDSIRIEVTISCWDAEVFDICDKMITGIVEKMKDDITNSYRSYDTTEYKLLYYSFNNVTYVFDVKNVKTTLGHGYVWLSYKLEPNF